MSFLLASIFNLLLSTSDTNYITQIAPPEKVKFFYKHKGQSIYRLDRLHKIDSNLVFAITAQEYEIGYTPYGWYVENGKEISTKLLLSRSITLKEGIYPQGVFGITKSGKAEIVALQAAIAGNYKYAVQVSPLIVTKGMVNPQLPSEVKRWPAGYGILKDGRVLIAISKREETLMELAQYFLSKGCTDAAFIDDVETMPWTPNGEPTNAVLAVMVGVIK